MVLIFILPIKNPLSRKNLPFSKIFHCPGIHHLKVFSLPIFDEFHGPSSEEEKKISQELITKKIFNFRSKWEEQFITLGLKYYLFFAKIQSSPYSFLVSYKIKFLHSNELSYIIHKKEVSLCAKHVDVPHA